MKSWSRAVALVGFGLLPTLAYGQSAAPVEPFWVADQSVFALAEDAGVLYVGGAFSSFGPYTGTFAVADASTGVPDLSLPKVDGTASTIAPDGAGGWFIGGSFAQIGGVARNNLAHVLADGRVSAWNPNPNAPVSVVEAVGSTVYLGGSFTTVSGVARNRLAAVDAATGALLAWDPNVLGGTGIGSLAFSPTHAFLGGTFTSVGGQARNYVAKVSLSGAGPVDTTWNPNASAPVGPLLISGTTLYLSGSFTTIGGQPRNYLAALPTTGTGAALPWNPNPDANINSMARAGSTLYLGGFFSSIGNPVAVTRFGLATVDATSGAVLSWNPGTELGVFGIDLSGGIVYVGGSFNAMGGQPRKKLAAVDASTGAVTPWNPGANDTVRQIAVASGAVAVAGQFSSVGIQDRSRLAALNTTTGSLTPWNPSANSAVNALAKSGGTIYAGGAFSTVGGLARVRLAALDTAGAVTAWNPGANGSVDALALAGSSVIVGGSFTSIGSPSLPRTYIASLDAASGANLWTPSTARHVWALSVTGSRVYVGGGTGIPLLANLDLATGNADLTWNPNPIGGGLAGIHGLLATSTTVYAGGSFTSIGGQTRANVAALSSVGTGAATAWNPNPSGGTAPGVLTFALSGSTVFVGGNFYRIGGVPVRQWVGALDATTAAANSWNANADNEVRALAVDARRVYVAGTFSTIGGQRREGFAAFCRTPPPAGLGVTGTSDNEIDLAWTGSAPTYNVYRGRAPGGPYVLIGGTPSLSYDDTTAEGGVTYYYVVKAVEECESDPTPEVSATASGLCSQPPDFEGAAWSQQLESLCQVRVGWAPATSACGGAITYSLYRDTSPVFTPSAATRIVTGLPSPTTTYTDTAALVTGTTYYYVARSSTAAGGEDGNEIRMAATPVGCSAPPNPAAVAFLTATSTSGQNLIEWTNPASGPYGSTRILYRSVTGTAACVFPSGPADASATVLTNQSGDGLGARDFAVHAPLLNDNTTYCYAAFVNNGSGTFSAGRFVKGRPFDDAGPVKWAYSTGATSLAPPGIGSSAFVVSNDRILHSMVRGATGGVWPASWTPLGTNGPVQSRPPVVPTTVVPGSNEVVFLGSQDGYVYAADAPTGVLLWRSAVHLGSMVQAAPAGIFTAFWGAFDFVLVGTRDSTADNKFYALDAATGALVGAPFDNGGGASGIGIISGGASVDYATRRVYFASRKRAGGSSSTLWCLQLVAGGIGGLCPGWTSPPLEDVESSPVLVNGRIYLGNNLGRIFAVDASTGSEIWHYDALDGPVKGFIFPDRTSNRLYFSTTSLVWSLADQGGSAGLAWPAPVSLGTAPSTALFTAGGAYVYVGGSDGRLYQLDLTLASPTVAPAIASVALGDPGAAAVVGAPTLDRIPQIVYVGTDAGIVYAVQTPLP